MQWHYVQSDVEYGPYPDTELRSLLQSGVIGPETVVWTSERPDERFPLSEHPLFSAAPVAAVATATASSGASAATAPPPPPPPMPDQTAFCSECGRRTSPTEMIRFGDRLVCAQCKGLVAQRLREGGIAPGTLIYAGFWLRFLAILIDSLITSLAPLPLWRALGVYDDPNNVTLSLLTIPLSLLIAGAYEVLFVSKLGGTPGKLLLRMRVVTPTGARLSVGRSLGRWAARILSGFTILIGFIIAAFDSQKRALHDHIAGTRVIKVRPA